MSKTGSVISRRNFGRVSVVGSVALVLGGMSGCAEQVIKVEVEQLPNKKWRVKNIAARVAWFTRTIRFEPAEPTKWKLVDNPTPVGALRRAPLIWLSDQDSAQVDITPVVNGSVVTNILPTRGKNKLHVYFAMEPVKPPPPEETRPEAEPEPGPDAAPPPPDKDEIDRKRTGGGCGGGGDIEGR